MQIVSTIDKEGNRFVNFADQVLNGTSINWNLDSPKAVRKKIFRVFSKSPCFLSFEVKNRSKSLRFIGVYYHNKATKNYLNDADQNNQMKPTIDPQFLYGKLAPCCHI